MKTNICKQCSHTWIARKDDVAVCPRCKSYRWNEEEIEVEDEE